MKKEYFIKGYPVREIKAYTAKTGYKTSGENSFIYETPEATFSIDYELQPTGFGKKPLLLCPRCMSRRSKLYHAGGLVFCRSCIPGVKPYHGIQNSTKQGSDFIAYKMERLAKQKGLVYFKLRDFSVDSWIAEDHRPRYMRKATFSDLIGRLALLDVLRCDYIFSKYKRGKLATKETIRYICKAPPMLELQTAGTANPAFLLHKRRKQAYKQRYLNAQLYNERL